MVQQGQLPCCPNSVCVGEGSCPVAQIVWGGGEGHHWRGKRLPFLNELHFKICV